MVMAAFRSCIHVGIDGSGVLLLILWLFGYSSIRFFRTGGTRSVLWREEGNIGHEMGELLKQNYRLQLCLLLPLLYENRTMEMTALIRRIMQQQQQQRQLTRLNNVVVQH